MGLNFIEWLRGKGGDSGGTFRDVDCRALFAAGTDYVLRKYAFECCVDMIAAALGRADFRDYRDGTERRGSEWWTWNVEPGPNQNSSAFLHKLVDRLYRHNEALIVSLPVRGTGKDALAVADSWEMTEEQVLTPNKYWSVYVGGLRLRRVFYEPDVLRLKLHHHAMEPVQRAMADSFERMVTLARAHYEWDHGQHWVVHVNQIAQAATADGKQFEAQFAQMLQTQMKPFLENPNAVLPEFDGYSYTRVDNSKSASSANSSEDVRKLAEDIFNFTARGFLIPVVLVNGSVEKTADANERFLTYAIDPLADQLQEEINRKRYGFDEWREHGAHMRVDTSSILHYDLFAQAANIEKLIGSCFTYNEIQRAVGGEEINEEWANTHFLTKNIGRVTDVLSAANGEDAGTAAES